MKKSSLFIAVLSLVAGGCTFNSKPLELPGIQFQAEEIDSKSFHEKEKNKNDNVTYVFANGKNEIVRIYENSFDLEKAKKTIEQKSNEIKMLFAPQQAPYFGQITKEIKCIEAVDLKGELIENENEISQLLNLTATDRFIYGSCIADQEVYRSQLLFLFCKKSSKFYEIRYFYDKATPAFKKQIAHCS